ncbi:MAG TPA: prepilin peptidase [Candidatus Binatia bacterium]|nr:prepilin peptidase [Candidatus Binatia bacterium]
MAGISLTSFLVVFIFGAIVGSFLNVCILRIPNGESIIHPPSRCPSCKAPIAFYDNIPLLSYLILRGRCRACQERVSPRYFVVELLTACLTVALFYKFGLGPAFFSSFIFVAALLVISFVDLDVRIVPDVISLPGIVLGMLFSLLGYYLVHDPAELIPSPLSSLIGVLAGGGFLLALAWAYAAVTGTEGMGGGDIKLLAMIGAFLGWPSIPVTLFLSSLGGSIIGLSAMLIKGVGRKYALPFAPFLCLGALLHLFFGKELVALYLYPQ